MKHPRTRSARAHKEARRMFNTGSRSQSTARIRKRKRCKSIDDRKSVFRIFSRMFNEWIPDLPL